MKKTNPTPSDRPKLQMPRIVRMLRRLQPWLQSQRGRVAPFAEIGKWSDVPENTIRGWFAGQGNPTAEFLLALLERIPRKGQLDLLDQFCRVYPTLGHARLANDRTVISRLVTLLGQPHGITYIQGGTEEERTFVITGLGHSFWMLSPASDRVLGLDVHASDWFVPVPGVVYLDNLLQRDELLCAVRAAWPSIRNGESPLIVFNGVWSALPEVQEQIRDLAGRCHVLIADQSSMDVDQPARRLPPRTTLITISPAIPQSERIGIEIRVP